MTERRQLLKNQAPKVPKAQFDRINLRPKGVQLDNKASKMLIFNLWEDKKL
jgi:hypothetical protein